MRQSRYRARPREIARRRRRDEGDVRPGRAAGGSRERGEAPDGLAGVGSGQPEPLGVARAGDRHQLRHPAARPRAPRDLRVHDPLRTRLGELRRDVRVFLGNGDHPPQVQETHPSAKRAAARRLAAAAWPRDQQRERREVRRPCLHAADPAAGQPDGESHPQRAGAVRGPPQQRGRDPHDVDPVGYRFDPDRRQLLADQGVHLGHPDPRLRGHGAWPVCGDRKLFRCHGGREGHRRADGVAGRRDDRPGYLVRHDPARAHLFDPAQLPDERAAKG